MDKFNIELQRKLNYSFQILSCRRIKVKLQIVETLTCSDYMYTHPEIAILTEVWIWYTNKDGGHNK